MTTMFQVFAKDGLLIELADESEKQDGSEMALHFSEGGFSATVCTNERITCADVVNMSIEMMYVALMFMSDKEFAATVKAYADKYGHYSAQARMLRMAGYSAGIGSV